MQRCSHIKDTCIQVCEQGRANKEQRIDALLEIAKALGAVSPIGFNLTQKLTGV